MQYVLSYFSRSHAQLVADLVDFTSYHSLTRLPSLSIPLISLSRNADLHLHSIGQIESEWPPSFSSASQRRCSLIIVNCQFAACIRVLKCIAGGLSNLEARMKKSLGVLLYYVLVHFRLLRLLLSRISLRTLTDSNHSIRIYSSTPLACAFSFWEDPIFVEWAESVWPLRCASGLGATLHADVCE